MLEHEKHAGAFILRSATNLAGEDRDNLSDPYCLVFWNGRRIGRTLIITNTLEPQWDACFNLSELIGAVDPESENVLRIEVWDWDRISSDEFLGSIDLMGKGVSFLPREEVSRDLEAAHSRSQGQITIVYVEDVPEEEGLVDDSCVCCGNWGTPAVYDAETHGRRKCGCIRTGQVSPDTGNDASTKYGDSHDPSEWEEKISRTTGKTYYHHKPTGATTFQHPEAASSEKKKVIKVTGTAAESSVQDGADAPLPPGWIQKVSRSTGVTYYYNAATDTSVWERPLAPPLPRSPAGLDPILDPRSPSTRQPQKELSAKDAQQQVQRLKAEIADVSKEATAKLSQQMAAQSHAVRSLRSAFSLPLRVG